jgi:hypothetical protein
VHALSQQTPSAQKPDLHWALVSHVTPSGRGPQLPLLHVRGAMQSAFVVQTTLHCPFSQIEGLQVMGEPARQVPLPSQLEAGTRPPAEQVDWPQLVPDLCFAQPPSPLQVPSWPQVAGASGLQIPCGSAPPWTTTPHSPLVSGWEQLTHAPLHAVLQHTPSAQKPDAHSAAHPHAVPSDLAPPAVQLAPSAATGASTRPPLPPLGPESVPASAPPLPPVAAPSLPPKPLAPSLSVVHPDTSNAPNDVTT